MMSVKIWIQFTWATMQGNSPHIVRVSWSSLVPVGIGMPGGRGGAVEAI